MGELAQTMMVADPGMRTGPLQPADPRGAFVARAGAEPPLAPAKRGGARPANVALTALTGRVESPPTYPIFWSGPLLYPRCPIRPDRTAHDASKSLPPGGCPLV